MCRINFLFLKYACRKTLADSRPRIRGRFARTIEDCEEPNFVKEINRSCSYDDLIYEVINLAYIG